MTYINTYTLGFRAECPTNKKVIRYHLVICSRKMIRVEDLRSHISDCTQQPIFHEDLADMLADVHPGHHTMTAYHHGVDITTQRGSL